MSWSILHKSGNWLASTSTNAAHNQKVGTQISMCVTCLLPRMLTRGRPSFILIFSIFLPRLIYLVLAWAQFLAIPFYVAADLNPVQCEQDLRAKRLVSSGMPFGCQAEACLAHILGHGKGFVIMSAGFSFPSIHSKRNHPWATASRTLW